MKTLVISYSMSGNNEALAASLASALPSEHIRITESKSRSMLTIILDMMFKRTPKVTVPATVEASDFVVFAGPVWMGQIATPLRACFKELGPKIDKYAFVSISGGADGPNPNLESELKERMGKAPACVVDMHIADLMPPEPKPERKDTMHYHINEQEVKQLTDTAVAKLQEVMGS